jgi:hypothetical protein
MFLQLVDDVRAALAARGFTEVSVDEGIRARVSQENYGDGSANRVAFVPAVDPMSVVAPTFIGEGDGVKRQLWNVLFVYDVAFAGFDADNPERDLAHRRRCFDLWEVVAQAIHADYYGSYEWTSARWTLDRKDGVHGAELVATLVLNIPLFDRADSIASPGPVPGEPKPVT